MKWQTHALVAVNFVWPVVWLSPSPDSGIVGLWAAAAILGGLAPDLDAKEAKIKYLKIGNFRPFAFLSNWAHRTLGHRGLLHSLWGVSLALTAALIPAVFSREIATSFVLGYVSHLAADACTPHGIPLLYPDLRRHHLLPRRRRITTGSATEDFLLPFLAAGAAVLLLSQMSIN